MMVPKHPVHHAHYSHNNLLTSQPPRGRTIIWNHTL